MDLPFAFRARKVSSSYINNTVIPMLCRKASVPAADVRGHITSHRARSTIASLGDGAVAVVRRAAAAGPVASLITQVRG